MERIGIADGNGRDEGDVAHSPRRDAALPHDDGQPVETGGAGKRDTWSAAMPSAFPHISGKAAMKPVADDEQTLALLRGTMLRRLARRLPTASWPLVDQGIISLGTFLFNIVLARSIPLAEYGHYAMALGILLLMQAASGSLIFYPMSIYAAVTDERRRRDLVMSSLVLTVIVCVPMTLLLGTLVWWLIDASLLLPAFAALAAGQLQEAIRRGLLSGMRHGTAIIGDGVRYLGQVVALLATAYLIDLDLPAALYVMAAAALVGAAIQFGQSRLQGAGLLPMVPLVRDFWRLGKWSLTSNVLGLARTQCLPWLLATFSGPAAAGAFQIVLNVFNLTTPIVTGICNIVPQMAARALPQGYRAAWQASWPLIATGAPIIGCCCVAMLAVPNEFVALFYGNTLRSEVMAGGIRILATGAVFAYASSVCCAFLHGVEGGRDGLLADLASTGVMLVIAVPLTLSYGLVGGCAALACSLAARTAFLIIAIHAGLTAAVVEPYPQQGEAVPDCR